jgi:hypothetical protein
MRLAHLPYAKTLAHFDFSFQPSTDEWQIRELQTLRFVHDASNVVLLGPPGVGGVALATEAIHAGFGAYFLPAHDLATYLGRAAREGRLDRRLRVYLAPKVVIIDETGYLPLDDLRHCLIPARQRPLRAGQHHAHEQQGLCGVEIDLRGSHHHDCHLGSPTSPLADDQHPQGKLSAQRTQKS